MTINPNPPDSPNPKIWKRKAMAFVIRSHRHLWGKNNEDPLVFLFRGGLTNEFSKQLYLGWNKFSQERPCEGWGLEQKGSFLLPAGIVFPYIIEKELMSVFIISMEGSRSVFRIPGSVDTPVILGDPNKTVVEVDDILKGLSFFQENQGSHCVKIDALLETH